MTEIIRIGFKFGPMLFGLLFIAPVTAQVIAAVGIAPPFGLAPLAAGFVFGGFWGLFTQISGSWLIWKA